MFTFISKLWNNIILFFTDKSAKTQKAVLLDLDICYDHKWAIAHDEEVEDTTYGRLHYCTKCYLHKYM
jgi:hypothetical protein